MARLVPRSRRWQWLAALGLTLVGTGLACGPSVQSIHEGSVRFEHCYRLDLDLDITPGHREACWKEWLAGYTYGQTRDRIDYARRRVRAFVGGDTARPELAIGGERRPEERQFYLVVPGPSSMHATPAPIATRMRGLDGGADDPTAPTTASVAPAASIPGQECAGLCTSAFDSCQVSCGGDAGSDAICKSCTPDFKSCMKRCFE